MSAPARPPQQSEASSSFSVKVDDDGITSVKQPAKPSRGKKSGEQQDPERAITDVTKLIREKLKNLPAV
jgi:hypothetical protein